MTASVSEPLSPTELLEALQGRHCGIIQDFDLVAPRTGDWPWYYGGARTCDVGLLSGDYSWRPPCGGIGLTRRQAAMGVIGEVVERYCAAFKPDHGVHSGSEKQLSAQHTIISPRDLSRFSSAQSAKKGFFYTAYTEDSVLEWFSARSLSDDQEVLVPAAWTLIPYLHGSRYYIDANSTGLACGGSRESAIENAAFEVIERDAYSLCWLYQGTPPRLLLSQQSWAVERFPVLQHKDWDTRVYDLTGSTGFPVILVVLRAPRSYGDRHGPWVTHGVACHLDARLAFEKAAREAMLGYYYLESRWQHFFSQTSLKKSKQGPSLPTDFDGHADFYNLYPRMLRHTAFLDRGGEFEWGHTPGTREDLTGFRFSDLCVRLRQAGFDGAWVDLTTREIKPLGLHVVRVLIKGLNWLHGNARWPYLGTVHAQQPHRYYHYIREGAELNPWPHSLG